MHATYPADLGARCEPWDERRHILCKGGSDKAWCKRSWCYVDPCKCDVDVLPQVTLYQPETTYRNMPLFYSYETCGGKDAFQRKDPPLGHPSCRCVGFAGIVGTTEISFRGGHVTEYPGDLGATCKAWDHDVHPECKGDKQPSWCRARWCYVDPCECELPGEVFPKLSAYMPDATLTGKNLYYSYETCGSPDTWTTDNNEEACVNQETEDECGTNPRCAWSSGRCLGRELVMHPLCKETAKKDYKLEFPAIEHLGVHAGVVGRHPSHEVVVLTVLLAVTVHSLL